MQEAARAAAGRFWLLLHDFTADRSAETLPTVWGNLGHDHPFLAAGDGDRPFRANVPAGLHLPG